MSDVPLLKKNIPVDKRELMTIMEVGETHYLTNIFYGKDVLDALRKFQDDVFKILSAEYNGSGIVMKEYYEVMKTFKLSFGVLEEKERDSP
jgi:hypothetical protein